MNALMKSYPIDEVKKSRMNMSDLVEWIDSDGDLIERHLDMTDEKHTKHYFANGAYVREMSVPANTVVVGRIHKYETINILLEGEIEIVNEDGTRKSLKAPHVFIAPPGNQKAAITITPVRWLNSMACKTTDHKEAEKLLTCETIQEYNKFADEQRALTLRGDL